MNCPVCHRGLLALRVGSGVTVPCRGPRRWVVSGRCPHRGCGASLFAWSAAPDEVPPEVVDVDGFLAWRRAVRPPFVPEREMVPALVVALVMATFVALASWAMLRTLELSPDLTSRVLFGVGPALVLLSQAGFAWLGLREAIATRVRDELLARSELDAPGGLRLSPEPGTYRG